MRSTLYLATCLLLTLLVLHTAAQHTHAQHDPVAAMETLPEASTVFIPNKGQWQDPIHYRANLSAGQLYVDDQGLLFDVWDTKQLQRLRSHATSSPRIRGKRAFAGHVYQMEFIGGDLSGRGHGEQKTNHYYNYYKGQDRSKWRSRVWGYYKLHYPEIYNGVDLEIYARGANLKYDLIVAPGADVSQIRWKYDGLESVKLKKGQLQLTTSVGKVIEDKPFAYQVVSGERVPVACHYKMKNGEVFFSLPDDYDHSRPLVIDPTLIFGTYSGFYTDNFGYTATFDSKGNLYAGSSVFGNLSGSPFGDDSVATVGAYDTTFNGGNGLGEGVDMAITKYDSTQGTIIWSTFLGGSNDELPHSVIVNSNDECFVFGTTSSPDYPYTTGCYDSTFNSGNPLNLTNGIGANYLNGSDIVITRLSSTGASLMASTFVGGTGNDGINQDFAPLGTSLKFNYADEVRGEIEIDANDNIYVATCTQSSDFPIVGNTFQPLFGGGQLDGVVVKMDNNLTNVIWSSYLGGENLDAIYSLAIDSNNEIYVAGGTKSDSLFDASVPGLVDSFSGGRADGFVAHLTQNGDAIQEGTYWGSAAYDQIYFVDLDRSNNAYVFGQTQAPGNTFIQNALYNTPNSGQLLTKFTPELDSVIYSTVFGTGSGTPNISPTAFLVDLCNKIYLSGWGSPVQGTLTTAGMDTAGNPYQGTTAGNDFYLMVLEDDASQLVYGSFFGGPNSAEHVDGGTSRFDRFGRMYQAVCAGCGSNDDFPTTPGSQSQVNNATFGGQCNNGLFKFDFNLPVVLADFDNTVDCLPTPISFTNNSYGASSYWWDFGDGSTPVTTTNPSHTFPGPGLYTVTLAAANPNTCNFSDTARVDILVLANGSSAIDTAMICVGENIQIGVPPLGDTSLTFQWIPENFLTDPTASNPFANPPATTDYTLLISNGNCTDTIFQTVEVIDLGLNVSNDTTLCATGDSVTLTANGFGGSNINYTWSTDPNFTNPITSGSNATSITVAPITSTTYYVMAEQNGCSYMDSVNVNLVSSQIQLDPDQIICLGDTIQLNITNLNPADSLTIDWSPDADIISGDGTQTITIAPTSNTTYTVIVQTSLGCTIYDTVTVSVSPLGGIAGGVTADTDTIFQGGGTFLHVTPTNFDIVWSPAGSLDDPNSADPFATPDQTTTYSVIVSDNGLCSRGYEITIHVIDVICGEPDVYIPNAFTPNNDGENDVLFVRGNNLEKLVFRVYDRWGEKVFETTDQSIGWDGTFKGRDADPAVYVYYLEATCVGDEQFFKKGNVTLIR